ncbi:RNI-like protein [Fomitiporia mediterranea MF3/22]|uniref:RNI-like protein n=1 Tax=Fomitiporia mediterranea (strain MF3/22) TaxID=694068 RepID=UPI000440770C|nr:RNI-like protein [Fomitiporia mediterranea MF3/22]EJD03572.1 RNI-like protein [Fomitiporia mediterranea MF3/22]
MSKRQQSQSSSSKSQTKRVKTVSIGAPSPDDRSVPSENNPSSSALSTRSLKQERPPSLSSLCIRAFSRNFAEFSDDEHWDVTRKWLQILPETALPGLFAVLKAQHPRRLNHAVITTYFMRGTSLSLDGDLPLTTQTLAAIPRVFGRKLLVLELSDVDKFSDSNYAAMVNGLPSLTSLVLRYPNRQTYSLCRNCPKVGPLTVEAVATTCRQLIKVNFSFTSITASSLLPLLKSCPGLEVLKLAGIQNLSDATLLRMFASIKDDDALNDHSSLRNLKSLKLRHDTISEAPIVSFLHHCTKLERLDVSFTLAKHVPDLPIAPPIEKLSLTSTFIPGKELIELVTRLPRLKILNIGAMGVKAATSTTLTTSTAMTLNDDVLRLLTDALAGCCSLQSVNLVQNSKLGATKGQNSAIAYFIRHVGRKLSYLNLSGVAVRSADLAALVSDGPEEQTSPLETLILNKSLIDDDCAPWISSCRSLKVLELAETRISGK